MRREQRLASRFHAIGVYPFQSFMKTKLKVISSQIRKSVRKLMPQPCRAFRSRARLELGRKAWRSKLELE